MVLVLGSKADVWLVWGKCYTLDIEINTALVWKLVLLQIHSRQLLYEVGIASCHTSLGWFYNTHDESKLDA
jgi:hypothetical protein